jgi:hypothetical protein
MSEMTPAARRLRRVAPLALVVVLATACGDDNKSAATPSKPPSATTRSGDEVPAPTVPTGSVKAGGKGTLMMGTRNLLPLLGGSIGHFAPTQAEGKSLRIVALAGLDSFWAGRTKSQRILVKMRLKGGSAPTLTVGQKVDFVGLLTASVAGAGALGVRNDADRTLLEKQGAYVDASVADVKLH